METSGPLNPTDPRSARSLRTAQRVLNQGSTGANATEAAGNADNGNVSADLNNELKDMQNQVLEQLSNMSTAIAQISTAQTNVASIRIEQISLTYFTREVRPLLDALYFISISSLNIAGVAQVIQSNTFGERKELRESLELVYEMNHELNQILESLSRRMKIYIHQIKKMDKDCPPFVNRTEDS
ncbi:hypothetical protein [Clostridium sp. YIM B02500]|uniref:hypothetical protein n=1 Tax=Clostridium sp. YIM B02500 TaxID=2910681 RepID=UPI001EED079B|nr:hypothetical protein [Clostridium sp. YIM B02500]